MGKGSKKQQKVTRNPSKAYNDESMDDEIDAFHKQRDVIPLDVNAGSVIGGGDSDEEQPVFDFEGGADYDSGNGTGSDDDDTSDDINDDIQPKGFAAKIVRQAKFLRQKFGGGDDEMHDDDEEEEEKKAVWGRRKSLYYSADNVDFELQSSDEDLPAEEEAEVLRLQREKAKSLSMEDFGLEDGDRHEYDSDGLEKKLKDVLDGSKATKLNRDVLEDNAFESYEEIKKDLSALSKEEKMDVVYSSAPELVGLLSELNEALDQLKKVKPLLCKVRERKDLTRGGMHYLEVKHILLLTYCQAIAFYLLLKSEGHPVRDHPVIARLVEIRNLLEKLRRLDVNFSSQIEEIVDYDHVNDPKNKLVGGSVALELEQDMPSILAKPYEEASGNEIAELVKDQFSKDYDSKSSTQKHQEVQVGLQSLEMLKVRASLEAKLKQKGIYNSTTPKPERTEKHTLNPINQRLETLDDFDDEVKETTIGHFMNNGRTSSLHLGKLSRLVVAKVNKPKFVSGDDDLPTRDDIGERRRKHELRVLGKVGTEFMDDDMGDDDGGLGTKSMDADVQADADTLESEDEFYKEVKKQRAEKLMAKAELYSRTPAVQSLLDTKADGKRQITHQMEKNRGLTRPRKKITKIPRKKYKIKHQKAVVRRKGQVRDIRKPTGPYGGEMTGINTNVSRSIRF